MEQFPFAFDDRYAPLLRFIGVTPTRAMVTLTDDDQFDARFGRFRARTVISNIRETCVTRDYRWYKAIGPRGSAVDRGATFGTNTDAGLCLLFHEPVPILFGDLRRNTGLTVTVADPDGLAHAIQRRQDALDPPLG